MADTADDKEPLRLKERVEYDAATTDALDPQARAFEILVAPYKNAVCYYVDANGEMKVHTKGVMSNLVKMTQMVQRVLEEDYAKYGNG